MSYRSAYTKNKFTRFGSVLNSGKAFLLISIKIPFKNQWLEKFLHIIETLQDYGLFGSSDISVVVHDIFVHLKRRNASRQRSNALA